MLRIKAARLRGYSKSPTIHCSTALVAYFPITQKDQHHGTYAPAAAIREERARSAHVGGNARVSLWQAPPSLRHEPEQPDQGYRVREPGARRNHQEVVGRCVQQLRASLEPHVLLELPEA